MTTTLIETPAPDPIADAIAALTAAARRERTIGAGTPNEHIEPVDWRRAKAGEPIETIAAELIAAA